MLNGIFVFVVLVSVAVAALTGRMHELTDAIVRDAGQAVTLAIGLVGVMAFFLGLMRVAERSGLLALIARAISPVMRRLFPGVPPNHPAMSAMVLNISSNMLGLANAATPFGIKAMEELDRLNSERGTATNAMVVFLAVNTSGFALLPSSVIGLRASLGSTDAAGIIVPTMLASGCATIAGVTAALLLARLPRYRRTEPLPSLPQPGVAAAFDPPGPSLPPAARRGRGVLVLVFWSAFLVLAALELWRGGGRPGAEAARALMSYWILPALVAGLISFGWYRGVRVYDAVVDGAQEGFQVALRIIPYLVAILVAVGMLRAAGGIDLLVRAVGPWTERFGLPAEALPMALLRPFSGSGAYGVMAEIMTHHGPDSLIGMMVSTMQGSTETTFYVLAVYCGAVGVKRTRHMLPACIAADVAGLSAAVLFVRLLF